MEPFELSDEEQSIDNLRCRSRRTPLADQGPGLGLLDELEQ